MSIVVLGANAPQNKECGCLDCEIRRSCKLLKRGPYQLEGIKEEYRKKYCPIRELPKCHGRLIDADALLRVIEENSYRLRGVTKSTENGMFLTGIRQAIDESPTIIEAGVSE